MISTQRYIRKPLYVDAVRVTAANFEEIAAWCQGEIQQEDAPGKNTSKKFIRVRVQNPKNPRQTKAFVGDWILYTETGYKVYTVKAFHAAFDKVEDLPETTESTETPLPPIEEPGEILDPEPGKIEPTATEGRRVLSAEEQEKMTADEIREMVQSGDVVLAQDIARP